MAFNFGNLPVNTEGYKPTKTGGFNFGNLNDKIERKRQDEINKQNEILTKQQSAMDAFNAKQKAVQTRSEEGGIVNFAKNLWGGIKEGTGRGEILPEIEGGSQQYQNLQDTQEYEQDYKKRIFARSSGAIIDAGKKGSQALTDFGKEKTEALKKSKEEQGSLKTSVEVGKGMVKNLGELATGTGKLALEFSPLTGFSGVRKIVKSVGGQEVEELIDRNTPEYLKAVDGFVDNNGILNYKAKYANEIQKTGGEVAEIGSWFIPITRAGKVTKIEQAVSKIPQVSKILNATPKVVKVGEKLMYEVSKDIVDIGILDAVRGKTWEEIEEDAKLAGIGSTVLRSTMGSVGKLLTLGKGKRLLTEVEKAIPEMSATEKKVAQQLAEEGKTIDDIATDIFAKREQEGIDIYKGLDDVAEETVAKVEPKVEIKVETKKVEAPVKAKEPFIQEAKKFEKAKELSTNDRGIETKAFNKIEKQEDKILADYKSKNGKIVNTDDFRPYFKEEGYVGSNSASVQEPSSYLSKKAFTDGLKNDGRLATFYAGGSGSGKSSAIKHTKEMKGILDESSVVLDGNLSSYNSAIRKVNESVAAGKAPYFIYTYREPVESFVDGVVKRMKNNKAELGRIVPSKVVAENHIGSIATVKRLQGEGYKVSVIDNSLGFKKQKLSTIDEVSKKFNFTEKDLAKRLDDEARKLYNKGDITKQQLDGYLGKVDEIPTKKKTTKKAVKEEPKKVAKKVEPKIKTEAEVEKGFSKHFEKIKEKYGFTGEGIDFTKKNNIDLQKKAYTYTQRNPKKALRIAYNLEKAPDGQDVSAIRRSMMQSLDEAGRTAQAEDIARLQSKGFTEAAQQLNVAKLDAGERVFKDKITKGRLEKIGKSIDSNAPNPTEVGRKKITSESKIASKETRAEVVKELRTKTLKDVDSFINKIIC